jgi:hypothetical protein
MRESGPASVSLIVCESVLHEDKTGAVSAIRIMDILMVGNLSVSARFFVLSYVHSRPLEFEQHIARVQLIGMRNGQWVSVADAPPHPFAYSYQMEPSGPGGFMLTTEFNLNLATFGDLGTFWVQLSIDGVMVEQAPLTLLRRR